MPLGGRADAVAKHSESNRPNQEKEHPMTRVHTYQAARGLLDTGRKPQHDQDDARFRQPPRNPAGHRALPLEQANEAIEHLRSDKARYRIVLDR